MTAARDPGERPDLDLAPDSSIGFRHNPDRPHPCDFACGGTWVCTLCGEESQDSGWQHECRAARAAGPVAPPTVTMIVNGTPREIPFAPGEAVGVLAHRALAADGYGWTSYELRDETGALLMERTPAVAGETVYITKPIGWGG